MQPKPPTADEQWIFLIALESRAAQSLCREGLPDHIALLGR
jgi:hypothetical protein